MSYQEQTQSSSPVKRQKRKFTNELVDQLLIDSHRKIIRCDVYTQIHKNMKWKCLKCGNIWLATAANVITKNTDCKRCIELSFDQKIDLLLFENDAPIIKRGLYTARHIKIQWQCLKCHNLWMACPGEVARHRDGMFSGSGCPECAKLKNEKLIGTWLSDNGIQTERLVINTLERQYRPDYYIPGKNLIIEYNGIQHFEPHVFINMTIEQSIERFGWQKVRDDGLRKYCAEHNINLLEIDGRQYTGNKLVSFLKNYFSNFAKIVS